MLEGEYKDGHLSTVYSWFLLVFEVIPIFVLAEKTTLYNEKPVCLLCIRSNIKLI